MSRLVVMTQRGIKIQEHPIQGVMLTIGRSPTNDVQINNPGVSSRHARIIVSGYEHILEDLDSRNGTYINREKVTRQTLKDGDQINFPNCKLLFLLSNEDDEPTYKEFSSWWHERKTGERKAVSNDS